MIKNRDIIIVSLQPWDIEIGSNCKNIALEFARHNRVLYVNSPLDRSTLLRQRNQPQVRKRMDVVKGRSDGLIKVAGNIWTLYPGTILESISRLRWNRLFDFLNRVNNRRLANEIIAAATRLNFKNYILFNDNNIYRGFYLKEMLNPALSVYYSRDNIVAIDFWKRHGKRLEPALISKSDLVLTNSAYLSNNARKYNPDSTYVGQGCDLTLYDRSKMKSVPPELEHMPHPVIGYTGVLYSLRLDPAILEYMAIAHPGWNIVLIGPEDEDFRSSRLHQLKNVHFLGSKHPEDLPVYVNSFDVAINPQKVNELTIGNYPRKIDEYLALGKPVVATRTEAMNAFAGYVLLADTKEEFSELTGKALAEDSTGRVLERELFAHAHTWENSVGEIYHAIEETMAKRSDRPVFHAQDEKYLFN